MLNPTPRVGSKYGAPMGRHTGPAPSDCVGPVTLRRIRLDSCGYDPGGAYWGIGRTLYWAHNAECGWEIFFRAADREAAKAHVLALVPDAKFYR